MTRSLPHCQFRGANRGRRLDAAHTAPEHLLLQVQSPLQVQLLLSTPTSPGHFQLNLATSAAGFPCHEHLGTSRKRSRPQ